MKCRFSLPAIAALALAWLAAGPGAGAGVDDTAPAGNNAPAKAKDTRPAHDRPRTPRTKEQEAKGLAGVKAAPGFEVTLFAAPPDVRYPTCLTVTPRGEVFVGIDENGSLDARADRGRVVRCVDDDGDGRADRFNDFARMDSPRGLIFDAGTLYVLHPPFLSAYHDDDGDGRADRSEDLIKGLGFDLNFRGADHTTNGIRLGIDGWIYVAVGDYGFIKAVGKDGGELQLHGGGIVRVRPDGTGLESFSRGQRNIYDVAIDPRLNVFTRDNTNDGGGWDVRLSHVIPTGNYGYPSLFAHFSDEIVAPLADYGGGSPTGSLYVHEPGLPADFGDTLYTCEWGRSAVFRHPLEPNGAGFKAGQVPFVELPRPTDIDIDGQSRFYVSSWKDGSYRFDRPDVGYLVRVTHPGTRPAPFPDLKTASDAQLLEALGSASHVLRQSAQREALRRGARPALAEGLERAAAEADRPIEARVAAIFTLELLLGEKARGPLVKLTHDATVREFALRALSDRSRLDPSTPEEPFRTALSDPSPRVRLQAVVGLARLGKSDAAPALLERTADSDPLVAHAAINALVALKAIDVALDGLDPARPKLVPGSARVLQALHETRTVDGLVRVVDTTRDDAVRLAALKALCRLYHREADWDGHWWGTRPDTSGPYFKSVTWSESDRIGRVLKRSLERADTDTARRLLVELLRNKIDLSGTSDMALKLAGQDPALRGAMVDALRARSALTASEVAFLGTVAAADGDGASLQARALRALGRHLEDPAALDAAVAVLARVAMLANPNVELLGSLQEFLRDPRLAQQVVRFRDLASGPDRPRGILGYAVLVGLDRSFRTPGDARTAAHAAIDAAWRQPETAVRLLRAIALTRADNQAEAVRARLADANPEVRQAAVEANRQIASVRITSRRGRFPFAPVAQLPYERVLARVQSEKGDPEVGARLFEKQGCIACHTVVPGEPPKGPFLGGISARYNRAELAESVLKPSAKIAQGFETQKFATVAGLFVEGFVVRESGDEVELRNAAGNPIILPKSEIDERGKTDTSIMPTGLVDSLTVSDLASLLAYLESLKAQ